MKIKLCLLFSILYACLGLTQPDLYYQIESQTPQNLIVSFYFNKLDIRGTSPEQPGIKYFEIPGLSFHYEKGKPVLPVLSIPLVLPQGQVGIKITVQSYQDYQEMYPPMFKEDYDSGEKEFNPTAMPFIGKFPDRIVTLRDLGLFREYRMASLVVYPVQVRTDGVRYFKSFRVILSFPEKGYSEAHGQNAAEINLIRKFVSNKGQVSFFSPQTGKDKQFVSLTGKVDYDAHVRIIIKEKGIYHITGNDLAEIGIDLSKINPHTLRLTNRGKEIAFFLVGERDNTFDPEDYIDFWGEPNYQTFQDRFPDLYTDPFSDQNVYWLEWGGTPGIRMVEESGSPSETNPANFNQAPFYSCTVHVENNVHFERLGYGNTDRLSYTRDLWFFDSGVKAISKKQYPFQLVYPDPTSFNPVVVEAMFSGKSLGDFPHRVNVWLNNSFVGFSKPDWFGQDTSRISNRNNSTIRNLDLVHGENTLEVQLSNPPPEGSDIVLLNWFEVTYDKQYRAYRDFIEFKRPSIIYSPDISLYQFEIKDFTRPDIEIFKKGVSKVVNYKLETEIKDDRKTYAVTFQDRVLSDDVEFVALSSNQKKKPFRIEPDEPFDPENPTRFLRDPNNSADFIIITHGRFYESALEYRDYRRSTGLNVELVNVQDIYDEFNDGLKSPLAIRNFLKYVFYNWDQSHRLKYVLFLGDANFDYKKDTSSSSSIDFVPTFFYQTFKFGAAATDFPYSLLSGNDQIPDVFVGRIPVTTNSDLIAVLEKVKEYEQASNVGSWHNQALFISGNDASTYEFENHEHPLFRSQNSRVLEILLPDYYSAFRLNTIKDPHLTFDPNYGGTTDLIEFFDDGVFYINFMGHGGGAIWADMQLFNLQDVERLNNKGKYPFVTSMTCFTGAFDNPGNTGLAQKLLLANDRGAIGVFASSGLGWAYNDFAILWAVDQYLFNRSLTVGQAVTLGKIQYMSTGLYFTEDTLSTTPGYESLWDEMVYQYNLLGDPYIKLSGPEEKIKLEISSSVPQPGDTVVVSLNTPVAPAEGHLEIADLKNQILNRIPLFITDPISQLSLSIPENFPEGTGRVRAYLSNGLKDASGVASIGVNFAVIDSFQITPARPRATDSVNIVLYVSNAAGVRKVYLLVQELLSDTLHTVRIAPNTYKTVRSIPPTNKIKTVFFDVFLEDDSGNTSIFRNLKYQVTDQRPDLFVFEGSLKFGGVEKTQLQVSIGNGGDSAVEDARIDFYDGEQNFIHKLPFVSKPISILARDSLPFQVDFPLDLSRNLFSIYVEVDPLHEVPDFNRANNVDQASLAPNVFSITPSLGSTLNFTGSDTLSTNPVFKLYFPPGIVDRSTAVRVSLENIEVPTTQKGLVLIPLVNQNNFQAVNIQLLNPEVQLLGSYFLSIKLKPELLPGGADVLENVKLYQQHRSSQPWLSSSSTVDTIRQVLLGSPDESGLFAPFLSSDVNPPNIELTINGRPIKKRAQVSANPTMYVVIEDENGLNLERDQIQILIDGQAVSSDKVFIPDSLPQGNLLGLTVYPELSQGEHHFVVEVKDVNGNTARKEFEILVSDEFDIHVFGNYPNPFSDQTIFSYFVSPDVLDELEIRIYTLSGRLIKRITEDVNTMNQPFGARSPGYNELIWNGTDEGGVEVANGVYFAVIRARYQGKVKEKVLKVAKLK